MKTDIAPFPEYGFYTFRSRKTHTCPFCMEDGPIYYLEIHDAASDTIIATVRFVRCGHIVPLKKQLFRTRDPHGYIQRTGWITGQPERTSVWIHVKEHIWVWMQAHPGVNIKNKFIRHINGVRDDNRIENLVAISRTEGCTHS